MVFIRLYYSRYLLIINILIYGAGVLKEHLLPPSLIGFIEKMEYEDALLRPFEGAQSMTVL
jgi:hypothetical protein